MSTTTQGAVDAQDGMFDREIEDAALEEALEQREKIRQARLKITGRFKEAHEKAKAQLGEHDMAVGDVLRVGRFRIKLTETEGRSVQFDTAASERLTISLLGEDGAA